MKPKEMTGVLSPIWAMINAVARPVLSRGATKFPCPVISIGNIVAGGVGKTEITAAVAKHCIERGLRVVIAQRGYRSSSRYNWESRGGVAFDFDSAVSMEFPDEALVVLKKVPGAMVTVGASRSDVLLRHWEELNPDVVLLDDGLQHFKISRDLDVVVHDFSTRFPILRDLPRILRQADPRIAMSDVPKTWMSGAPWVRAQYVFRGFRSKSGELFDLESISKNKKLLAFCGIANPTRFLKTLQTSHPTGAGAALMDYRFFPDHARYTDSRIRTLAKWQQSHSVPLVTTLKDYVKLSPWIDFMESHGGVYWADIELKFLENEGQLWRQIDEILASRTD